jgi:hypothetical protein
MEMIIAACGLDCAQCGAYIASMKNDNELRKKVAAGWTQAFNFAFTPEMIDCHGCFATDGVQIGHCAECEMRLCAIKRGNANCGACADYPCKTVSDFHASCPEAAKNLGGPRP